MKNKKTTALISAITGVCILSGAAFANYQTANGYDTLKKSLLSLYKYENCTLDASYSISADGEEIGHEDYMIKYDLPSQSRSLHSSSSNIYNDNHYESTDYYQDGAWYWSNTNHYGYIKQSDVGFPDTIFATSKEEWLSDRTQKIIRFIELLGDTIIGDLKNNFMCIEDGENTKTYEISLSAIQIPELINAGLGAVFSINNADEYLSSTYDPIYNMQTNQNVDSVFGKFTVDENNMLIGIEGKAVFKGLDKEGKEHDITININADFKDIGTTIPDRLDIENEKIFTNYEDMYKEKAEATEAVIEE